jgi:ATP-dependent exoDNAse (exonuclease V) alpha subunit
VVIIDEAGMVDTRLLHEYSRIARVKNWRTVLVGDHHQLDAVDAGGMFAELVNDPDITTVELDTLHRFEHDWEAKTSLSLRNRNESAVEAYDQHGRIHGHTDQAKAIEAVAAAAVAGVIEGRDVLIMAPTNAVVDNLNELVTTQLLEVGWLDPNDQIEAGGCVFHPGQPVVTRANDRTLTYGPDASDWVRNGDRWTVNAGAQDDLYLTNIDNGNRLAPLADYVAAGNVTVDYASTINRAQGATVDEAHMIIDDRTNAKQLYVGTTRGRNTNYLHTAPPAFDLDQHGPTDRAEEWTPTGAVARALQRQPDDVSALARRRQLRETAGHAQQHGDERETPARSAEPTDRTEPIDPTTAAMHRLQTFRRRPSSGRER